LDNAEKAFTLKCVLYLFQFILAKFKLALQKLYFMLFNYSKLFEYIIDFSRQGTEKIIEISL